MPEMCEWPLRLWWQRPQPVNGGVDPGSSDAEEFGEFDLGVCAEVVQF
jgi:hypothetical protein